MIGFIPSERTSGLQTLAMARHPITLNELQEPGQQADRESITTT